MTTTIQVTSHGAHALIKVFEDSHTTGHGARQVAEVVVDPGDVEMVNVWQGRRVEITEIAEDHPLLKKPTLVREFAPLDP